MRSVAVPPLTSEPGAEMERIAGPPLLGGSAPGTKSASGTSTAGSSRLVGSTVKLPAKVRLPAGVSKVAL